MLTEKQKRGFEWLYNGYSFNKECALKSKKEWRDKMMALRSAVSILGGKFVEKKIEEAYGVKYTSYRLEEE